MQLNGPISVYDYMNYALFDQEFGYYQTLNQHQDFTGDFITSPEISPIFGELLAGWLLLHYENQTPKPSKWIICECGGGKGLLMQDICQTITNIMPDILPICEIHLLEKSPILKQRQQESLSPFANSITLIWHDDILDLKHYIQQYTNDIFLSLIANEFFDCLPVHQMIFQNNKWFERRIYYDDNDDFTFIACDDIAGLSRAIPDKLAMAKDGDIISLPSAQAYIIKDFCDVLKHCPSLFLIIDYGEYDWQYGDGLQAIWQHEKISSLDCVGKADLTITVNFTALKEQFTQYNVASTPIITQGTLLDHLGIQQRIHHLIKGAPQKQEKLMRIYERLCGDMQMGQLFKCLCAYHQIKKIELFD